MLGLGTLLRVKNFLPFTRVTLQVQMLFMLVPFLIAPLILMALNIPPSPGDQFADRRLISNGSYSEILVKLLYVIIVCQITYLISLEIFVLLAGKSSKLSFNNSWNLNTESILILLILASLTLILARFDISNPILFAFRKLGATTTCFSIIFYAHLNGSNFQKKLILTLGSIITIFETISYGFTKAPVLAVALSVWIWALNDSRISRKKRTFIGASLLLAIPIVFKLVQLQHLGAESNERFKYTSARYPDWISLTLPFIQRFDLLSSLTDAFYAGKGAWLSTTDYIREVFSAFFWNYGFEGLNFGARWAIEISSKSISGNAYTGVSLSQGPIAEGYIIAGVLGSAIVTTLIVFLTLLLCEKSYSGRFVSFLAVDMFAKNSLFEQGLVGNAERLTGAFKILVVLAVIEVLISGLKSKPEFT